MKKQTAFLIGLALVFGALYVFKFTDWFRHKEIQIKFRSFPNRSAQAASVGFILDREYQLTSIRIYSAPEIATNKYAHALWHLISETNSAPIDNFVYGASPAGMKPKYPDLAPELLSPKQNYRIIIEAGKIRGEKDFQIR